MIDYGPVQLATEIGNHRSQQFHRGVPRSQSKHAVLLSQTVSLAGLRKNALDVLGNKVRAAGIGRTRRPFTVRVELRTESSGLRHHQRQYGNGLRFEMYRQIEAI